MTIRDLGIKQNRASTSINLFLCRSGCLRCTGGPRDSSVSHQSMRFPVIDRETHRNEWNRLISESKLGLCVFGQGWITWARGQQPNLVMALRQENSGGQRDKSGQMLSSSSPKYGLIILKDCRDDIILLDRESRCSDIHPILQLCLN